MGIQGSVEARPPVMGDIHRAPGARDDRASICLSHLQPAPRRHLRRAGQLDRLEALRDAFREHGER
jgi:hypothetical protein